VFLCQPAVEVVGFESYVVVVVARESD
jgi:hypothetical protein